MMMLHIVRVIISKTLKTVVFKESLNDNWILNLSVWNTRKYQMNYKALDKNIAYN